MSKEYCHYTLDQIRESGLLSVARCTELDRLIDKAIGYVYDSAGKRIESARLVTSNDGTRWLHPNPSDFSYLRQTALAGLLNVSELQMINDVGVSGEKPRFERAKKLTEWDGGIFDSAGDFHQSVDQFIDTLNPLDEWPEYVWTARQQQVIPITLDLEDTIGHIVEDRGWEDMDYDDLEGTEELKLALRVFAEANRSVISHWEDTTTALLINKADWIEELKSDKDETP